MPIEVTGHVNDEVLHDRLVILTGNVTPQPTHTLLGISILTLSEDPHDKHETNSTSEWPIFNSQFKAIVELKRGKNVITLSNGVCDEYRLQLFYIPSLNIRSRFVRPVYIICSDDKSNGEFQAPEGANCSARSACKRIALGARLMKAFTAAKLTEHGFHGKTFLLEEDLYPDASPCHVFRSKLTLKEVYSMSGGDLWIAFAKELMSSEEFENKDNCKWLAFMSFTRYVPPEGSTPKSHSQVLEFTKGHTALGGGGLALFGTGTLHTWAESLDRVLSCFTDTRKIDRTRFMDDSAYRETYWANYSTGLGAALHELGHTFDLAHTPTGIMARGFDDLYKVFTAQPLPSRRGSLASESRTASPIAYSPRQSPVHTGRRRVNSNSETGSRGSSPGCGFNSLPRTRKRTDSGGSVTGSSPAPAYGTFLIESDFKKLSVQTTQSFSIRNYDGSETRKTITRYRDGMETVAEMTYCLSGKETVRETVKNLASGKTRTVLSLTYVGKPRKPQQQQRSKPTNGYTPSRFVSCRSLDETSLRRMTGFEPAINGTQSVSRNSLNSALDRRNCFLDLNGCYGNKTTTNQSKGVGDNKGSIHSNISTAIDQSNNSIYNESSCSVNNQSDCSVNNKSNSSVNSESKSNYTDNIVVHTISETICKSNESGIKATSAESRQPCLADLTSSAAALNDSGSEREPKTSDRQCKPPSEKRNVSDHSAVASMCSSTKGNSSLDSKSSSASCAMTNQENSDSTQTAFDDSTVKHLNANDLTKGNIIHKETHVTHPSNQKDTNSSVLDTKVNQTTTQPPLLTLQALDSMDTSGKLTVTLSGGTVQIVSVQNREKPGVNNAEIVQKSQVCITQESRDCNTHRSRGCSTQDSPDTGTKESRYCSTKESRYCSTKESRDCSTQESRDCSTQELRDCSTTGSRDCSTQESRDSSTQESRDCSTPGSGNTGTQELQDDGTQKSCDTGTEGCSTQESRGCSSGFQQDCSTVKPELKTSTTTAKTAPVGPLQIASTTSGITTPTRGGSKSLSLMCESSACGQEAGILNYRPRRIDGGAHWYRSSAVILASHKWFNEDEAVEECSPPVINRFLIQSQHGLRLVEIRHPPEDAVVHHWEFPPQNSQTTFSLPVETFYDILGQELRQFTVLAMDVFGNIAKRKFDLDLCK